MKELYKIQAALIEAVRAYDGQSNIKTLSEVAGLTFSHIFNRTKKSGHSSISQFDPNEDAAVSSRHFLQNNGQEYNSENLVNFIKRNIQDLPSLIIFLIAVEKEVVIAINQQLDQLNKGLSLYEQSGKGHVFHKFLNLEKLLVTFHAIISEHEKEILSSIDELEELSTIKNLQETLTYLLPSDSMSTKKTRNNYKELLEDRKRHMLLYLLKTWYYTSSSSQTHSQNLLVKLEKALNGSDGQGHGADKSKLRIYLKISAASESGASAQPFVMKDGARHLAESIDVANLPEEKREHHKKAEEDLNQVLRESGATMLKEGTYSRFKAIKKPEPNANGGTTSDQFGEGSELIFQIITPEMIMQLAESPWDMICTLASDNKAYVRDMSNHGIIFLKEDRLHYLPAQLTLLHELIHILHNAKGTNRKAISLGDEQLEIEWSTLEEFWTTLGGKISEYVLAKEMLLEPRIPYSVPVVFIAEIHAKDLSAPVTKTVQYRQISKREGKKAAITTEEEIVNMRKIEQESCTRIILLIVSN